MRNPANLSFGILCFAIMAACSGSTTDGEGVKIRLPWLDPSSGSYKSQDVEVNTLSDVHFLEGSSANVLYNPSFNEGEKKFEGKRHRYRFVQDGEVHVPADIESLQVASVYAHIERLRALDRELGLGEVLAWPRTIGVQVRIPVEEDSDLMEVNNAYYDGRIDTMVIVPYQADDLPITLNGGVIAHEHFHALFQRIVLDQMAKEKLVLGHLHGIQESKKKPQRLEATRDYNLWLLRAVNEGIADVWAWIYNQDDGFVGRSLPTRAKARSLMAPVTPLPSQSTLANKLKSLTRSERISYAYSLGTRYARLLRSLVAKEDKAVSAEERKEFSLALLKGLRRFAPLAREHWYSKKAMDPGLFIAALREANPQWAQKNCRQLSEFTLVSNQGQPEECP